MSATTLDRWRYVSDGVSRYSALVTGSVLDVLSDTPIDAFDVWTEPDAQLRLSRPGGGLFALAGYAERAFPRQALPHTFTVTAGAASFRAESQSVTIPREPDFPLALPPFRLEPHAVRIQGRVTRSRANPTPVVGARIELGAAGLNLTALRLPLRYDHAALTIVRPFTLGLAATSTALKRSVGAGEAVVALDSVAGLALGDFICVDPDGLGELCAVQALGPTADEITLSVPLARSHRRTVRVAKATLTGAGAATALSRAARAGDGTVVLDAPLNGDVLELGALPEQTERAIRHGLSDVDGYYGIDGIRGVRAVAVRAGSPPPPPPRAAAALPTTWFVNHRQPINLVNLYTAQ